jgi:phage nucleotide-binding protein
MTILIKNTKDKSNTFVNIIVYGDSGTGKTSLARDLDHDSTLIVSLEDGLLSLDGCDIDYTNAKTISQIMEIVNSPDIKKYKTIMIDSITELSQNTFLELKTKYEAIEKAENKKPGTMAMKLWGDFTEGFSRLFKELRRLEKNVVAVALPTEKEDATGAIFKKPDVYGKSSDRIIAWFDECFYMYVDKDGARKFLTETARNTMAKDRSGKFDKIIDANIGSVIETILK